MVWGHLEGETCMLMLSMQQFKALLISELFELQISLDTPYIIISTYLQELQCKAEMADMQAATVATLSAGQSHRYELCASRGPLVPIKPARPPPRLACQAFTERPPGPSPRSSPRMERRPTRPACRVGALICRGGPPERWTVRNFATQAIQTC